VAHEGEKSIKTAKASLREFINQTALDKNTSFGESAGSIFFPGDLQLRRNKWRQISLLELQPKVHAHFCSLFMGGENELFQPVFLLELLLIYSRIAHKMFLFITFSKSIFALSFFFKKK